MPTTHRQKAAPERDATQRALRALRARRRQAQRGVALILVLGALAILTVMLTEFQDATSAELGSSLAARDQVKAEYAARSAVNLTRLLFAAEPTMRVALAPIFELLTRVRPPQIPVWEYSDVILGPFGDEESNETFRKVSGMQKLNGRNLGLSGAGFEVLVVDEDSKINLNLGGRADSFSQQRMAEQLLAMIGGQQYLPLFEDLDERGDRNDVQTVCGAIIDWPDPNTDQNPCDPRSTSASSGTEDGYYQLLDRPYQRKNAPFDSLEELHLVRGVDDRFWETFVQTDPDDPRKRNVTVWGSGGLNVNAATPLALLSLACHKAVPDTPLCTDPQMAMQFISTLTLLKSFQQGVPIFKDADDFLEALKGKGRVGSMMVGMGLPPIKLLSDSEVKKAIEVKSKVFSIYARGYVRSGKRQTRSEIHVVIDMRGAPPPGTAEDFAKMAALREAGFPGLGDASGGAVSGTANTAASNPFLTPNPGGTILYYRID